MTKAKIQNSEIFVSEGSVFRSAGIKKSSCLSNTWMKGINIYHPYDGKTFFQICQLEGWEMIDWILKQKTRKKRVFIIYF